MLSYYTPALALFAGLLGHPSGVSKPCRAAGIEPPLSTPPAEKGIALGLFSMDPKWDYDGLIDELAGTGASHISLVWVWWQNYVDSINIYPKPRWTATEEQVLRALRSARRRKLHVTLFPIMRLVHPQPGEWRGRIRPANEDEWWRSYTAFILRAAELAAHEKADRFLVGSELLTREGMRARWARLIDRLRVRHPALELMYSANWDHFRPVRFWDLVDVVGVTGYWEIGPERDPKLRSLLEAWRQPRGELAALAKDVGRPLVLTEIGYPSLRGGLRWPWDETRAAPVDLEVQRLGYEAFARAFGGFEPLAGVYFWNWFGFGGGEDGNYTPRDKPAGDVLRCWFRENHPEAEPKATAAPREEPLLPGMSP